MYAHLDSPGRDSHQQLQIFVRSQSFHGTTVINIEKNTTIADVKLTIEDQQGIPAAQQRLTHDGTTLKDHFTLAHYQLQSEQTLILHLKIPRPNAKSVTAPASVSIVVEQLNGNGFTLKRAQTDTIRTLKAEIERKYGIQIDHQCLLLNDMELNDESTVDDNSIKSQTILKLVFSSYHKYKSEQQSVVNNMDPESAKVSVILERTVKNLNDILSKSRSCIGSASSLSSQLKETLNEKMVFFEKQYEKWDVLDVMEWIKTIEDGYFGDKRFETFINVLKEMEVNGPMLPEINNNLFLKATAGLKQESERHILRKHVNRIVANVKLWASDQCVGVTMGYDG
eukprot:363501_1